jgi:hypothetical protein
VHALEPADWLTTGAGGAHEQARGSDAESGTGAEKNRWAAWREERAWLLLALHKNATHIFTQDTAGPTAAASASARTTRPTSVAPDADRDQRKCVCAVVFSLLLFFDSRCIKIHTHTYTHTHTPTPTHTLSPDLLGVHVSFARRKRARIGSDRDARVEARPASARGESAAERGTPNQSDAEMEAEVYGPDGAPRAEDREERRSSSSSSSSDDDDDAVCLEGASLAPAVFTRWRGPDALPPHVVAVDLLEPLLQHGSSWQESDLCMFLHVQTECCSSSCLIHHKLNTHLFAGPSRFSFSARGGRVHGVEDRRLSTMRSCSCG